MKVAIVKFIHPGCEYIPSMRSIVRDHFTWDDDGTRLSGLRFWNNLKSHKRKFMSIDGCYIEGEKKDLKRGKLTFWGEWEAQSKFTTLSPANSSPKYIHEPFLDTSYTGERKHNTDPFVFGDNFWYTNCHQRKGSYLTNLTPSSIILFGTVFKVGFRLDTVFVVKKRYGAPMCLDLINSMSQQLRDTNLLHNNLAVNPSGSYLGLYQGLMYQEDKQLFSFVPCKPYKNGQVQSHERPILDRASFRLSGINQGYSHIEMTEDEGKEYWEEIVKVCICQGFSLGVSLALPPAFASTGVKNPSVAGDVSSACSAASS